MTDEKTGLPLLRTKLHRPRVARNHFNRQHLLDRLDQCLQRPSMLVSAPAGYGNSTLLACRLEASDIPSAWVSLDKNDNNLHLFPACFPDAVQTLFPAAGDVSAAARLVEQKRHTPLNEDKWYILEKWLTQLPDEIVQQRPKFQATPPARTRQGVKFTSFA